MKKTTIFALVAVLVLVAASGAFAWGGRGGRGMVASGTEGTTAPMMQRGMAAPGASGGAAVPMMGRGMAGRTANGRGAMMGNQQMMKGMRGRGASGGMGGRGMMSVWANVEIPQEIRDKQVEMQKLSVDMRAEMQKKPVDRAKVEELYKKRVKLRDAFSGWRMKTRLDMIEQLQK